MILKVYIQKHLFHLPRKQDDLTRTIKETFYKRKPLVKTGFAKLYPISDIELEGIKYEKNVNIFLINLYLLVMEHQGKLLKRNDIKIKLSDENIIKELSKILNVDIKSETLENIESKVDKYIHNNEEPLEDVKKEQGELDVEFNIDWVKAMDKKIKE